MSLLLVAVIFIAIGGISLSRNAVKDDNRVFQNFNAKEKVAVLSDNNLRLDKENKGLIKENEALKAELEDSKTKIDAVEKLIKAEDLIASGETENAKTLLEELDASKLSETALKMYNNLLSKVKENTNGWH